MDVLKMRVAGWCSIAVSLAVAACTSLRMTPPETGGGGAGGSTAGAGGSAAATGGSAAATGGSAAATGGSAAGRGGSAAGTSGSTAGTGGSAAGTAGSAAGTGGSTAGTGGSTGGRGGSSGGRGGGGGRGGSGGGFGGRGGSGGTGGIGGTGGSGGGTGGTAEPAGLIAFWRFDEGSGTTVVDSSGNGQTLTLSASGSDWATGHAGGGLSVDGTSGYAGVVPFNGQELYSYPVYNLSFSAWIKPDPAAASLSFATAVARAHEDYLFEDFWLGLVDGRPACMIHNPNWQGAVATAAAPAGAWTHIACTYDSTIAVTLYVDGAYAASTSSTEGLGPIPTRILVGAAETDALQAFFPGVIDDVRIYKTTLTLSEVASIAK